MSWVRSISSSVSPDPSFQTPYADSEADHLPAFCGVFPKKKSRLCSRQLFFFFYCFVFYFRIKRMPSVFGPQWLVTVEPASVSRISANGGS